MNREIYKNLVKENETLRKKVSTLTKNRLELIEENAGYLEDIEDLREELINREHELEKKPITIPDFIQKVLLKHDKLQNKYSELYQKKERMKEILKSSIQKNRILRRKVGELYNKLDKTNDLLEQNKKWLRESIEKNLDNNIRNHNIICKLKDPNRWA